MVPLSIGYMQSLTNADKLKEVTSFNQLCKTPIRVRRVVNDDNDDMDDAPLDDDTEEENGNANQSVPGETNEVSAVASEVQNPQERPSEPTPYLNPKPRKNRGSRMNAMIANEKARVNASSKPSKDAVAKERVQVLMGAFPKGQDPKPYSIRTLNYAKILEYFSHALVLQSDEKQWYSSIGLKPTSGSSLHASLTVENCNAIRVSLLVWNTLQSYKLKGNYTYLNKSCFRDSLIQFLLSRDQTTTDPSFDTCRIQSILKESRLQDS